MQKNEIKASELEGIIKARATDKKFKGRVEKILKQEEDRLIVESPYKLSADELSSIVKKLDLTHVTGLEVENKVRPDLLAGLVIKFKNHYFDFSLRGKLLCYTQTN